MKQSKIAVTGGLGSGKSAVCQILKDLGYPVFSCDEINRELWGEEEYLAILAKTFPDCLTDGKPDKRKLAAKVFSDEAALKRLDDLAHPRIMQRLITEMEQFPVSFGEVPLLFEQGYAPLFDGVIAVRRDKEARIRAVTLRDHSTRTQALSRMEKQLDPDKLETTGCLIIENNGSCEELRAATIEALKTLQLS